MDNVRTRSYRFLLYPDNKSHMVTLKLIMRSFSSRSHYVGIWHHTPFSKKHCHVLVQFENPRSWFQLLKDFKCEDRFIRPIGYEPDKKSPDKWRRCPKKDNWIKACIYLPHYNDLEKEQYSLDDLWGDKDTVKSCRQYCIQYQSKNLTQAECLLAVKQWILRHYGDYIRPMEFVTWITGTPYMKVANSSLVQQMIRAHNDSTYYAKTVDEEDVRAAIAERIEKQKQMEREYISVGGYDITDFTPIL